LTRGKGVGRGGRISDKGQQATTDLTKKSHEELADRGLIKGEDQRGEKETTYKKA